MNLELLALELSDGLTLGKGLGHRFTIQFVELWFVVEGFQVGRSTGHAKKDDPFHLGWVMRNSREAGVWGRGLGSLYQLGQKGGGPERETGAVQESTTVDEV